MLLLPLQPLLATTPSRRSTAPRAFFSACDREGQAALGSVALRVARTSPSSTRTPDPGVSPVAAVASGGEAGGTQRGCRSRTARSRDGNQPGSRASRAASLAATAVQGAAGPDAERPLARARCRQLRRSPAALKGGMDSKDGRERARVPCGDDLACRPAPHLGLGNSIRIWSAMSRACAFLCHG